MSTLILAASSPWRMCVMACLSVNTRWSIRIGKGCNNDGPNVVLLLNVLLLLLVKDNLLNLVFRAYNVETRSLPCLCGKALTLTNKENKFRFFGQMNNIQPETQNAQ